jgi:hypothetical protein
LWSVSAVTLKAAVKLILSGGSGPVVMGQSTKSLRDSPLRGGKSREAVASREESDGESTRSPRSTSLLLQRSTLDQAHQVDLRPVSDAAMARCWNDKMALTNSANQVA